MNRETPIDQAIKNMHRMLSKCKKHEEDALITVLNMLVDLRDEETELIADVYCEALIDVREIFENMNILKKSERYVKNQFKRKVKDERSENSTSNEVAESV